MKAMKNPTVVFPEPGKVVIEEREAPQPEAGELLIKTRCSLISTGTELTILNGEFPKDSAWGRYGKFPFCPGYDNIGEVVGLGRDVDKKWLGMRVATCGRHAQYIAMPAAEARPIHRDITDEQGSFFAIADIVMNGVRRGDVRWGESAAVYGLGLLGQMAVRFCRLCGAKPALAIDTARRRLDCLPDDSGIIAANPAEKNLAELAKEATRDRMVDVVFEVTGNHRLIPEELAILRRQGRFVILSSPRGKTEFDFHDLCNAPSFTIIGAHGGSHPPQATLQCPWTRLRHAEMFFDLIADKEIDVAPLISHRKPYADAPALYEMLRQDRGQAMGVVLNWA